MNGLIPASGVEPRRSRRVIRGTRFVPTGIVAKALAAVSAEFDVPAGLVLARNRQPWLVPARFCLYLVVKRATKQTAFKIAPMLDRDRATVLHGVEAAERLMVYDPIFASRVVRVALSLTRIDHTPDKLVVSCQ